ncbi:OsmC family protein [Rubritalea spongiae]|uniref:OsmC family protein n=1 Tax=Rubritalea spongiae TaxID=430797 RepID=A0ABW5E7X5_9BACT
MVEITTTYEGQLRCKSTHGPSGQTLETDAPVDNHGKGESFSPTDLVATALGNCMLTIIGIVAQGRDIPMDGLKVTVQKEMSADLPRRIIKLSVRIEIPIEEDSPLKDIFINAAMTCPVHKSLHPDIEIPIEWVWQ